MPDSQKAEIHIASFLVHVRPESLDAVLELLEQTPGLEGALETRLGNWWFWQRVVAIRICSVPWS